MSKKTTKQRTAKKKAGQESQVKECVDLLKKENKKRHDAFQNIFDHIDALFEKADAADHEIINNSAREKK